MDERTALHIARNPSGYTEVEQRQARLRLADLVEQYRDAYENMREWAKAKGIETATRHVSQPSPRKYGAGCGRFW